MKRPFLFAIAFGTAVGASGIVYADVIPPQETACQGLSLGAVCNYGTCEDHTCGRLYYYTDDAGVFQHSSYQYACLYCMDAGRVPDAATTIDADVGADAGESSDADAEASATVDASPAVDASAPAIVPPAVSADPGEDSSCAVGRFSTAARSIGPWLLALVGWVPIAISRARRRR